MTEAVEFPGVGGSILAGRLESPPSGARAHAVFAHCFACGKDSLAAVRISRTLAKQGIGVLRFDFAGVGDSEGEFGDSTFGGRIGDILAAARWLEANGREPRLLIGHSLGGSAVLAAASALPKIRAVCTVAAPFDPGHLRETLGAVAAKADESGSSQLTINGRRFEIRRTFLRELAAHRAADCIAALRRPLLVVHCADDEVLSVDHAKSILSAALEPKRLVSISGADHLLTRAADAHRVGEAIATWAAPYLLAPSNAPARPPP